MRKSISATLNSRQLIISTVLPNNVINFHKEKILQTFYGRKQIFFNISMLCGKKISGGLKKCIFTFFTC